MKMLNFSMVVLAICALPALNSQAGIDPASNDSKPEASMQVQASSGAHGVIITGTLGTQSYPDVEEDDRLTYGSGTGDAVSISIDGGSSETIPYPSNPQGTITVHEVLIPYGGGKLARVNLVFEDGDLLFMDIIEWDACPC